MPDKNGGEILFRIGFWGLIITGLIMTYAMIGRYLSQ